VLAQSLDFQEGRTLLVQSVQEPVTDLRALLFKGFVVMLPALGNEDRRAAEAIVGELIDLGCVEICCVGPEGESLHDAVDWIVEDKAALEVVTTWHADEAEGCEYFLYAAGGRPSCLLALVRDQLQLSSTLQNMALQSNSDRGV
jgi:hypothetical protein